MGQYLGIFDGDRLVAMAGERMTLAGFVEVSAVCTHPDYRGRGYAKQLVSRTRRDGTTRLGPPEPGCASPHPGHPATASRSASQDADQTPSVGAARDHGYGTIVAIIWIIFLVNWAPFDVPCAEHIVGG